MSLPRGWAETIPGNLHFPVKEHENQSDEMCPHKVGQLGSAEAGVRTPVSWQLSQQCAPYVGILASSPPHSHLGDCRCPGPSLHGTTELESPGGGAVLAAAATKITHRSGFGLPASGFRGEAWREMKFQMKTQTCPGLIPSAVLLVSSPKHHLSVMF